MEIDISAISLDVQNFRHKKVATEREAIATLLSDEKTHKVADLAEDIISMKGLDPSSRLIVMADPEEEGHYVALEGNRRLTALKTLINPDLAINLPTHRAFRELSPRFISLGIKTVDCVVLNRQQAFEWIKRKHYTGMGGKGVIQWSAVGTARSDASEGRPPRWMIALQLISQLGHDADTAFEGIANKTTTVDRVLETSQLNSVLGISFDTKKNVVVAENGDQAGAAALLQAMFLDMADKTFTVSKVETAALQAAYIGNFVHLSVRKKPANTPTSQGGSSSATVPSSKGQHGTGATGSATGNTANNGSNSLPTGNTSSSSTRSKPARTRNKLADKGLRINNYSLNKLYAELRKLNVDSNPHIASAMIRIFIEKSTMVFLEEMNVSCRNPNGWRDHNVKLKDKIAAALHEVDNAKSDPKLTYAWDIANGVRNQVHSLDQLNRAIHDHISLPAPSELTTAWNRLHHYLHVIFQTLEANGK
ncbi:hypothetical protein F9K81_11405 [Brucella anthropi]|uniref:hypothetical protein n=1 Tax=Brucella anthropi TaxID=529 RepID=UPI00124C5009|nr:hypothetical protein [Brucella anthropi]KAB2757953.1 hypothetical protein F9K81_11405 [Brucella anthropi]